MPHDLFEFVLPAYKAVLEVPDDDVRVVDAKALIPIAAAIDSLNYQTWHSIVWLLKGLLITQRRV